MKLDVYWASDYAGIRVPGKLRLYYGYEQTIPEDPDDEDSYEEWCFVLEFENGRTGIKIPFSRLEAEDQSDCRDCLLHGIALAIAQGFLK